MKVFNKLTKIIIFPAYYIIHRNLLLGLLHKLLIKDFYYQNFKFKLNLNNIPLSSRSSFIFKTYEYNDRKLVEKYVGTKNKCIIVGGGLGFIPSISFHKSKNKILVFEINEKIIKNLKNNLEINNCKFDLYSKNLVFNKKKKISEYFIEDSFLSTSQYSKQGIKKKVENIFYKKINNFDDYNTLIIDGEGVEEYFISNLNKMKNIKFIIFELHNHLFDKKKIKQMFAILKKNKFKIIDKCFNSYYLKKS